MTHSLNSFIIAAGLVGVSYLPAKVAFVTAETPHDPKPAPRPELSVDGHREIDSQELMQGEREIVIRHGEEAYRLSVTRAGKLILRK